MRYLLLFLFNISLLSYAQEKAAFHPDMFNDWESLKNNAISNDGNWVFYQSNKPEREDSLIIQQIGRSQSTKFTNSKNAKFSGLSNYIVFNKTLPYDTSRSIKLAKQNKEKWHGKKAKLPDDSLCIYLLQEDSSLKFGNLKSYELCSDSSDVLVAVLNYPEKEKKKEPANSKASKKKKKKKKKKKGDPAPVKKKKKDKKEYTQLMYFSPAEGHNQILDSCLSYAMFKYGRALAYVQKSGDSSALKVLDLKLGSTMTLVQSSNEFAQLSWNESGNQLAFLLSTDTLKSKNYDLWWWNANNMELKVITDSSSFGLSYGLRDYSRLNFSENSKRLFISYARKSFDKSEKDSILKEEKAVLDVWSWNDPKLQTQQLNELKKDQKKTWRALINLELEQLVMLSDSTKDLVLLPRVDTVDYALLRSNLPYRQLYSWDWPSYQDYWRLNLNTGELDTLLVKQQMSVSLSPLGEFSVYFDLKDQNWWQLNMRSLEKKALTHKAKTSWQNELHDTPSPAYPYGIGGYSNKDSAVFIYDRYDIWLFSLYTNEYLRLTKGRENKVQYRLVKLDREQNHIDVSTELLIRAFDEKSKAISYLSMFEAELKELFKADAKISSLRKAKNAEQLIFTKYDYQSPPDLYTASLSFKEITPLSNYKAQMQNFDIGSVELVSWKYPLDDSKLDGLLYKPAGFKPESKYPMLVYFYERNSNNLHRFWKPQPTASIIYPSMYASLGYVVFVPDIKYRKGSPGEDAMLCINSGVDHILKMGFVDSSKMGLQGQSWGGYQTAFLVTQTKRYAAAMAGAPVSNMTSAYGGIRWGSGYSRMFQYERTQSRIGEDLWTARDQYIKNSPIFFADKVNTPLLIMHNDNDGAVPWYQGIEYFVSLRRLGKESWLLNYNGDAHNLRKMANKKDLSVRMMQFFDHYLKGSPAPEWMFGIPARRKGIDYGLEPHQD